MSLAKSTVSPPSIVEPGSCQAERIHADLTRPFDRVPVTPEWLADIEAKQKAYESTRRGWRALVGIADTNF
jgi:hypothetical protein